MLKIFYIWMNGLEFLSRLTSYTSGSKPGVRVPMEYSGPAVGTGK